MGKNQTDKVKEITDRLEVGIKELFDSEKYEEYLKTMSKFHNYSFNNSVLISMQRPDASLVAGYKAWQNDFGRNVRKGEKGIRILAPSPYKISKEVDKIDATTHQPVLGKDGSPEKEIVKVTVPAYKITTVFDISQTEGKELPQIATTLKDEVNEFEKLFKALEETSPVPIEMKEIEGMTNGYYHLEDKRIAIKKGMSEAQTIKTLIHEISHSKLHDKDEGQEKDSKLDRQTEEVQAESVAYTVCCHYGLDTSEYSFGYIAGWSSNKDLEELKKSMNTIRKTSSEIITSIDNSLKKQLEKEICEREKTSLEKLGSVSNTIKEDAKEEFKAHEDTKTEMNVHHRSR